MPKVKQRQMCFKLTFRRGPRTVVAEECLFIRLDRTDKPRAVREQMFALEQGFNVTPGPLRLHVDEDVEFSDLEGEEFDA